MTNRFCRGQWLVHEHEKVHKDLEKLQQWAKTERIIFNRKKYKVLHLAWGNE